MSSERIAMRHTETGAKIVHGDEIALAPRWGKCRVCGQATSQPPVCWDLRCEIEWERSHE
jgi:hypothetical protein